MRVPAKYVGWGVGRTKGRRGATTCIRSGPKRAIGLKPQREGGGSVRRLPQPAHLSNTSCSSAGYLSFHVLKVAEPTALQNRALRRLAATGSVTARNSILKHCRACSALHVHTCTWLGHTHFKIQNHAQLPIYRPERLIHVRGPAAAPRSVHRLCQHHHPTPLLRPVHGHIHGAAPRIHHHHHLACRQACACEQVASCCVLCTCTSTAPPPASEQGMC